MSIDEAYPIIEKLATARSARGGFAYFTNKDVYQEIWRMCLEAMDRYNPEIGPIENYLVKHVTNRLKNLRRDKYFRPGSDVSTSGLAMARMNLVNALSIGCCDIDENTELLCAGSISVDPSAQAISHETLEYIREHIPPHLTGPFEDFICKNKIRASLLSELRQVITEILDERN